jgi:hypothetical protein
MLMQGSSATGATGVWNLAAGATLEFRNGTPYPRQRDDPGLGTFLVSTRTSARDAIVTLNGGTLTSPFRFSGSTIAGTDRTIQNHRHVDRRLVLGHGGPRRSANDLTISGPTPR